MCMLLSKLYGQLKDRWSMDLYYIKGKHLRKPQFKDPIKYVDKETALVSDTMFCKKALE